MRKILPALSPALALICLTSCGNYAADTQIQAITLETDPPGAACIVDRADKPGGHVDEIGMTPGSLLVAGSRDPLRITCASAGYPAAQLIQPASPSHTYPPRIVVSLRPIPVAIKKAAAGKPLSIVPDADKARSQARANSSPAAAASAKVP